jgi:hypothetical protein
MAINKNLIIGGGVVLVGLFLAYRAKQNGKSVPIIGNLIPTKAPSEAPAPTE